jgi:hypothetical protein
MKINPGGRHELTEEATVPGVSQHLARSIGIIVHQIGYEQNATLKNGAARGEGTVWVPFRNDGPGQISIAQSKLKNLTTNVLARILIDHDQLTACHQNASRSVQAT